MSAVSRLLSSAFSPRRGPPAQDYGLDRNVLRHERAARLEELVALGKLLRRPERRRQGLGGEGVGFDGADDGVYLRWL